MFIIKTIELGGSGIEIKPGSQNESANGSGDDHDDTFLKVILKI